MSQANKQLVLQAFRVLDSGDPDAYAELHHPDYVNHEAAAGRQRGPEGARATAIFLNRGQTAPLALRANVEHNHVRHAQIAVVSVETQSVPRVLEDERVEVEPAL